MKSSDSSPAFSSRPVISRLCIAVCAALFVPIAESYAASTETIVFNIQATSLTTALNQFAEQSGLQLIYTSDMTSGLDAPVLKGQLMVDDALRRLLQGSGLQFRHGAGRTVVLERVPEPPPKVRGDTETVLPTIDVSGTPDTTTQDVGYSAVRSSGATRTDTPLKEVPQTVNVVNSQVIEAQQAQNLTDVVRNVSGVVAQSVNPQGGLDRFKIRGFNDDNSNIMVDGMSTMSSQGGGAGVSMDNVERVEVMKGPESILAGSVSPGGVINVVSKKPTVDTIRTAKVQYGSYGDKKLALDLGGAITDDEIFTYRLNMSKRDVSTSQADYTGAQEDLFAPAIGFKNDAINLIVGGDVTHSRQPMTAYTVALPGSNHPADFSPQRYGNKDDHFEIDQKRVYYDFTYEIPQNVFESMSFNSRANYTSSVFDIRTHTISYMGALSGRPNAPAVTVPGSCTADDIGAPGCEPSFLPDGYYLQDFGSTLNTHSWMIQNDLRFTFHTGEVQHKVLLGADRSQTSYRQDTNNPLGQSGLPTPDSYTGPIDMNDRLEAEYLGRVSMGDSVTYRSSDEKVDYLFQDQLSWKKWRLLVSYKRNQYTFTSGSYDADYNFTQATSQEAKWTHNYGLAYVFNPQITAYVNRNEGFQPNSNPGLAQALPPTESLQHEAGLKFNFLDGRLQLTTSVFRIEKSNVVTLDELTGLYFVGAGRKVRGFETDLQGRFLPGWNVIASFSYNDVINPKSTVTGEELIGSGLPKRTASLYTSYELQDGSFKGLGAGLGVYAQDRNYGEDSIAKSSEPLVIPGQAQTDVNVFYNQPVYRVNLGVKNVFGRTLYSTTSSRDYVPISYSEPVWTLSASYDF